MIKLNFLIALIIWIQIVESIKHIYPFKTSYISCDDPVDSNCSSFYNYSIRWEKGNSLGITTYQCEIEQSLKPYLIKPDCLFKIPFAHKTKDENLSCYLTATCSDTGKIIDLERSFKIIREGRLPFIKIYRRFTFVLINKNYSRVELVRKLSELTNGLCIDEKLLNLVSSDKSIYPIFMDRCAHKVFFEVNLIDKQKLRVKDRERDTLILFGIFKLKQYRVIQIKVESILSNIHFEDRSLKQLKQRAQIDKDLILRSIRKSFSDKQKYLEIK